MLTDLEVPALDQEFPALTWAPTAMRWPGWPIVVLWMQPWTSAPGPAFTPSCNCSSTARRRSASTSTCEAVTLPASTAFHQQLQLSGFWKATCTKQKCRDKTFDLIVSNPPFVAAPSVDMDLHRWGGEDGEDLIRTIVSGLRTHLRPGGTLSMVSDYPIMSTSTWSVERLAEWLGGSTGWGLAVFKMFEYTLEQFITPHLPFERLPNYASYRAEFRRWMDLYERLHIERMGYTMTYIRRLQPTRPGYSAERTGLQPLETGSQLRRTVAWMPSTRPPTRPAWTVDWDSWRPLSHRARCGWIRTPRTGQDRRPGAEPGDFVAWIASRCQGQLTAAELATAWSLHHFSDGASARRASRPPISDISAKGAIVVT